MTNETSLPRISHLSFGALGAEDKTEAAAWQRGYTLGLEEGEPARLRFRPAAASENRLLRAFAQGVSAGAREAWHAVNPP